MTTVTEYDVQCSQCSRPLGETTEDVHGRSRVGPCCENLPHPWLRDRQGLYTVSQGLQEARVVATVAYEDDDEDEDEVDHRPACSCGSHEFTAYVDQSRTLSIPVDTSGYDPAYEGAAIEYDPEDDFRDYDGHGQEFSLVGIRCSSCDELWRGPTERL